MTDPRRITLLTRLRPKDDANKFCEKADLSNEESVKQFFVIRLLRELGYEDKEILTDKSLKEIDIARGRIRESYRPDYAVSIDQKARWLIDAKATQEKVDDWRYQAAGYALSLNQSFTGEDPCKYIAITNGLAMKVWQWNEIDPILNLEFADFQDDSSLYRHLYGLLNADSVRKGWEQVPPVPKPVEFRLTKPSVEEAKKIFKSCHDLIWKSEKMNPQRAFFEFVKIMFVKLWKDKLLHEDEEVSVLLENNWAIPQDKVTFSTRWIDILSQQGVENPFEQVHFRKLTEILSEEVAQGTKKPIFDQGERIALHPGTVRQVVSRLERYDMFGIDEDLNGRLFETFLSATMRGQALGQYFTPRSVTKLMTKLAEPRANRTQIDRIIDACCGSGGFLIEALTDMRNEIRMNTSLSPQEAMQLNERVANDALFGIDAGQDPPLARIARINMYLHGDGGSRIYATDSLDKTLETTIGGNPVSETEELRGLINRHTGFDIALTNPPFSMDYSRSLPNEERILDQYDLSEYGYEQTSQGRETLSSRVMFMERYCDLLKPGGRLLTVIDDSTLGTKRYDFARQFIRERFIVRAIISLPGDAFQRVGARAKTSILYLVKRAPGETTQPDIFMAESSYIGLDDVPPKTPRSKADEARRLAEQESSEILENFQQFLLGERGPWLVPSARIDDRLDVKNCLPRSDSENVANEWVASGYEVVSLGEIVEEIRTSTLSPRDFPDEEFTFLRVRYDGMAEEGETRLGREITYREVQRATDGDIVVSNIAMAHGASCVFPSDLSHTLLSSEFTIMRITDTRFSPWYLWAFLRSPEVRARILSEATGISRHRVSWEFLKNIPIPLLSPEMQNLITTRYSAAESAVREAERLRSAADAELYGNLNLENEWALRRLRAAKPPK